MLRAFRCVCLQQCLLSWARHRVHALCSGVAVREQCELVDWVLLMMECTGSQGLTLDAVRASTQRHIWPTTRVRVYDMNGRQICPVGLNCKEQPAGSLPPHWTPEMARRCSCWGVIKNVDGTHRVNANYDERVDLSNASFVSCGMAFNLESSRPFGTLPHGACVTAVKSSAAAGHEKESPPTPSPPPTPPTPTTPPPPHLRYFH